MSEVPFLKNDHRVTYNMIHLTDCLTSVIRFICLSGTSFVFHVRLVVYLS